MGTMRYKPSDKVRIKSLDWYNENKDEYGYVRCTDFLFTPEHSKYCGYEFTISHITEFQIPSYIMESNGHEWTDEMIEGLVEEETKFGTASNPIEIKSNANCLTRERVDALATKIDEELPSGNPYEWECPQGYQFVDENGNVINAQKIVLEKKKKEYPKTYEECCKVLSVSEFEYNHTGTKMWYRHKLMATLDNLMICRDAYRKIAGEEMGLGEPWEPDYLSDNYRYCIVSDFGKIIKNAYKNGENHIFAFPTAEMRDAFYENFKEEIEICKGVVVI